MIVYHDRLKEELHVHVWPINRMLVGAFLLFGHVRFFRFQNYSIHYCEYFSLCYIF